MMISKNFNLKQVNATQKKDKLSMKQREKETKQTNRQIDKQANIDKQTEN